MCAHQGDSAVGEAGLVRGRGNMAWCGAFGPRLWLGIGLDRHCLKTGCWYAAVE